MKISTKSISVVLPCYNEEEVIGATLTRISQVIEKHLYETSVEIILVDDGSSDHTVDVALSGKLNKNCRLKILKLSRNFGHQAALSAGIQAASGEVIAILDADLQDPPELIPQMLDKITEGYDVVYGKRLSRHGVGKVKSTAYRIFYRLLRRVVTDVDIPLDTGDFRLISRKAADQLNSLPEKNRFIRGLLPYLGLSQVEFSYHRDGRFAGKPKYNLSSLIRLAFDGLVSFSSKPLRLVLYVGLCMFLFSILGVFVVVAIRLGTDEWVPGWAGMMVLLLGFGGLQMFFLGILGEYVGRILDEVKGRPPFVVAAEIENLD